MNKKIAVKEELSKTEAKCRKHEAPTGSFSRKQVFFSPASRLTGRYYTWGYAYEGESM